MNNIETKRYSLASFECMHFMTNVAAFAFVVLKGVGVVLFVPSAEICMIWAVLPVIDPLAGETETNRSFLKLKANRSPLCMPYPWGE